MIYVVAAKQNIGINKFDNGMKTSAEKTIYSILRIYLFIRNKITSN